MSRVRVCDRAGRLDVRLVQPLAVDVDDAVRSSPRLAGQADQPLHERAAWRRTACRASGGVLKTTMSPRVGIAEVVDEAVREHAVGEARLAARAGRAQWSVGSIDEDGMRYGFTTHALIASTIAIAPTIVTTQSIATRHPAGDSGRCGRPDCASSSAAACGGPNPFRSVSYLRALVPDRAGRRTASPQLDARHRPDTPSSSAAATVGRRRSPAATHRAARRATRT